MLNIKAVFSIAWFIQNLSFLQFEIALNQTLLVNLSHQNPFADIVCVGTAFYDVFLVTFLFSFILPLERGSEGTGVGGRHL